MEFHPPIDDIIASLNTVGAKDLEDYDEEFAREIAEHFGRFAKEVIAPLNITGDEEGCRLENGRVRMPKGFKQAYDQLAQDGWLGLTIPEEYEGQGLSPLILAITSELFSASNHAFQIVTGLAPGAVRTLLKFGTDAQKQNYIPQIASGKMLATMCLTEPSAGSDLSCIRTKATQIQDDLWEINGEKIFITGGDQDLSEDILHLVLARTSDEGLRGLSLFLVTGRLNITRVEEKMGIHASPTCQIAFDNTKAQLIGDIGQGLAAMFTMMNHARIDVALQGVAHAARATDLAKRYAAERKQGGKSIDQHADVARMIEEADYLAKSARLITHLALITIEKEDNEPFVEFLTPLVKAYATEAGMKAAELATQVHGGYGYLKEYGVEQIYRDSRISAIYEGANGIHTKTVATRGVKIGGLAAFEKFLKDKNQDLEIFTALKTSFENAQDPLPLAHDFTWCCAYLLADALLPNPKAVVRAKMHLEMMKLY